MEKANHNPPGGFTCRSIAAAVFGLGIISGAVYLLNFKLPELVPAVLPTPHIRFYVVMSVFLGVLYLLGTFLVVKFNQKDGTAWGLTGLILFFALAFSKDSAATTNPYNNPTPKENNNNKESGNILSPK